MKESKKPRLLYMIESLSYGGVERRRLTLAKRLSSEFEIELVCSQTSGELYKAFEKEGIKIHRVGVLGFPWNLKVIRKTIGIAREFKPDIIHGAVFEGVTLANISGWFLPGVKVISEETSDPQNRGKMGSLLLSVLIKRSTFVIGVSQSVAEYLKQTVQPKKVLRINNGVEDGSVVSADIVTQLKVNLGLKPDDFVVGFVGRLRNVHKRVSDLIDAAEILFPEHKQLKLLIVGGGFDEDELKAQAANTSLPGQIHFAGKQDDPNPYYACMDCFCIPSYMEAFGLVLVEAMFHELPVIATNVGGMKEIVVEGETGYLINRESPAEIAEALSGLMADPAQVERLGKQGRQRAIEHFGAENYANQVKGVYNKVLNGSQ